MHAVTSAAAVYVMNSPHLALVSVKLHVHLPSDSLLGIILLDSDHHSVIVIALSAPNVLPAVGMGWISG